MAFATHPILANKVPMLEDHGLGGSDNRNYYFLIVLEIGSLRLCASMVSCL